MRSQDVEASTVGDRVVLYHRVTRSALVLNPMATWLWSLLTSPRTVAELLTEIRRQFPDVAEERARADLQALIADLLDHRAVARQP